MGLDEQRKPQDAPPAAGPSLWADPRPLQERLLLKKLQVEADPDFSSGNLMQQQPAGRGALAVLFCSDFCHWNFSTTQEIIWGKLVSVEHGETQHVLVKVLDEELAVEIPLGIQGVLEGSGGVALRAHADLTVGVALSIWFTGFQLCGFDNMHHQPPNA